MSLMPAGEADFEAGFFPLDEAVQKLSFQNDCDVLEVSHFSDWEINIVIA